MKDKLQKIIYQSGDSKWFFPSILLSCVIVLFLRKPTYALFQQGRVEDVDVLIQEAIRYSWKSIFVVYNYYLHFIPRIVTLGSLNLLGIANTPLGMNLSAIVIASACAAFFATRQFRFIIKSDLLRALCSILFVSVSQVGDIFSNISSIQWFLNIFLLLFVSMLLFNYSEYEKKSKKAKTVYAFFCSVSFLSSAFSVIFVPVLAYVIIREARKSRKIFTISSYAVSTALLLVQTIIHYLSYSQQFKSPALDVTPDVVTSTVNSFTIVATRLFYYDSSHMFAHLGNWMYFVPAALGLFILLNSIRSGARFEIYALVLSFETLFWSSILRRNELDWSCLCGGNTDDARFFFFTSVFLLILVVRQLDKTKPVFFKLVILAAVLVIILNIASGFLIFPAQDKNWSYMAKFYSPAGKLDCYVGEVPLGWQITIPCEKPLTQNMTGGSITFTPPIVPTNTAIKASASFIKSGQTVAFTAIISPTPDYGQVQFYIDGKTAGKPVPLFDGSSELDTTLEAGSHKISASYLGAPNFMASTSDTMTVNSSP